MTWGKFWIKSIRWRSRGVLMREPYVYPHRNILKNLANIQDEEELSCIEGEWSCVGTELIPWLWIGRTKEVRPFGDRGEPDGHRRLAAIEGWVYLRPCRTERKSFDFVYPAIDISVPDTSNIHNCGLFTEIWQVEKHWISNKKHLIIWGGKAMQTKKLHIWIWKEKYHG